MTSRRDYGAEAVAAAKSVLVELLQVLGEFRDQIVVVGGWVPGLLLANAREPHIGTLDIDLALDFQRLPEALYATLLRALTSRGYRQDPRQPFRLFRQVPVPDRPPIVVEVDLLAGEYGGTGPGHRTQPVQDARARKARGCDLVFSNPHTVTIEGELPGGGRLSVAGRVAALVPWLVMKGMALADRLKEKDAYDIYYAVHEYPAGPGTPGRGVSPAPRAPARAGRTRKDPREVSLSRGRGAALDSRLSRRDGSRGAGDLAAACV